MTDAEAFFIAEVIRHARALPLDDCLQFVAGALASLGSDHPGRARLLRVHANLTECDAQFDLIASGQLKFEELLNS